jgi:hypothetical protein
MFDKDEDRAALEFNLALKLIFENRQSDMRYLRRATNIHS